MFIYFLLSCFGAYLIGSFCSAIVVSNLFNLPDPRQSGSKNPGATNVLRLAGKKYAVIVLVCDALKGTLPLIIGHLFHATPAVLGWIGLSAIVGHIYPLYFHFKGGKGVATALGVAIGFHPLFGLMTIATWVSIAFLFRFSSLASIITVTLTPFYILATPDWHTAFIPFICMSGLILFQHISNIKRLYEGKEPKLGAKKG